jgi:hypothetical protein
MELSIHGVTTIEAVGNKHFSDDGETPAFWNRKIVVTNDKGEKMTLNLFSGSPEALKVRNG